MDRLRDPGGVLFKCAESDPFFSGARTTSGYNSIDYDDDSVFKQKQRQQRKSRTELNERSRKVLGLLGYILREPRRDGAMAARNHRLSD